VVNACVHGCRIVDHILLEALIGDCCLMLRLLCDFFHLRLHVHQSLFVSLFLYFCAARFLLNVAANWVQ